MFFSSDTHERFVLAFFFTSFLSVIVNHEQKQFGKEDLFHLLIYSLTLRNDKAKA